MASILFQNQNKSEPDLVNWKMTVMKLISFDRSSSPIELHGVVMSSLDPNPNSTFWWQNTNGVMIFLAQMQCGWDHGKKM